MLDMQHLPAVKLPRFALRGLVKNTWLNWKQHTVFWGDFLSFSFFSVSGQYSLNRKIAFRSDVG